MTRKITEVGESHNSVTLAGVSSITVLITCIRVLSHPLASFAQNLVSLKITDNLRFL